ncbi:MAG: hypothetical protein ICV73_17690 [Acetobacteraceae bacterium]|nr:hypothetical protein [Acetobacteraceae bacterium]
MQPTTALLFQTHFFDRGAARLFERLRRQCPPHFECFVLMHVPPGTPKPRRLASVPHHFVSTPEIRALDYPRKNAERDWTGRSWEFWGGGHCDLVPMHFYNAHPHHARYWVVEYDVRFTGDWRAFFDAFEGSGSDFLSTSVRRRRDNPVWVNWESVQGPAPEDAIERHRVAAFTPIFRASQAAMACMDAAYRSGWGGHLEAAWASILDFHGLALEDIGGDGEFVRPGNRRRFYTAAKPNAKCDLLAPGTVTAKPPLFRPGSTPNQLYHPVKPFKLWPEVKLALWEARVWQGARRREILARLRRAGRPVRN